MTVSKIRLPDNTEHDIRAKYLIQSTSSDAVSAEFSARTVTEDAIANIQKIYGNTVVVSDNLVSNNATAIVTTGKNLFDADTAFGNKTGITKTVAGWSGYSTAFSGLGIVWKNTTGYTGQLCVYMKATAASASGNFRATITYTDSSTSNGPLLSGTSVDGYVVTTANKVVDTVGFGYSSNRVDVIERFSISISDPAYDGTYEPYQTHQIDLNIPTLTGKLNGTGSSVTIFPNGINKIGTLYDELYAEHASRKIGGGGASTFAWDRAAWSGVYAFFCALSDKKAGTSVIKENLSSLGYTKLSNDYGVASMPNKSYSFSTTSNNRIYVRDDTYTTAEGFKAAITSASIYYELATPQEYTLDNALQFQYPVVAGGTEMVLPTSGTAPMKMDVIYGNAADAAATMSQNFISVDSMKEFLDKLGTQMGGNWSMGYENGKYTFTFTSN